MQRDVTHLPTGRDDLPRVRRGSSKTSARRNTSEVVHHREPPSVARAPRDARTWFSTDVSALFNRQRPELEHGSHFVRQQPRRLETIRCTTQPLNPARLARDSQPALGRSAARILGATECESRRCACSRSAVGDDCSCDRERRDDSSRSNGTKPSKEGGHRASATRRQRRRVRRTAALAVVASGVFNTEGRPIPATRAKLLRFQSRRTAGWGCRAMRRTFELGESL